MSDRINKGWIELSEKQEIVEKLNNSENAFDTYKILQKVESLAKDPVLKEPDTVKFTPQEKEKIQNNLEKLAKILDLPLRGSSLWWLTDDNRKSVIYADFKKDNIGTAFNRQELTRILLSGEDQGLYKYFSDLLKLPPATPEDVKEAKIVRQQKDKDRQIFQELSQLPGSNPKSEPHLNNKRCTEVIQGAGNGQFVTSQNTDFIGTNGMGPCVALLVWQDFGDTQKAIVIHVDSFSGRGSLDRQGSAQFLDRYIGTQFIKNPNLKIHLVGATQGGRENLLEIYKYLESKDLIKNIISVDRSVSVVMDVKNGQVYPGRRI